jgi:predicted RNase H-like nuclease (RuvC/YqgF family)
MADNSFDSGDEGKESKLPEDAETLKLILIALKKKIEKYNKKKKELDKENIERDKMLEQVQVTHQEQGYNDLRKTLKNCKWTFFSKT